MRLVDAGVAVVVPEFRLFQELLVCFAGFLLFGHVVFFSFEGQKFLLPGLVVRSVFFWFFVCFFSLLSPLSALFV